MKTAVAHSLLFTSFTVVLFPFLSQHWQQCTLCSDIFQPASFFGIFWLHVYSFVTSPCMLQTCPTLTSSSFTYSAQYTLLHKQRYQQFSSCFSQCRHPPVTDLFLTSKHSSLQPLLRARSPLPPFNQALNSIISAPSLPAPSLSAHGTGPPSLPLPRKEQLPVRCIILKFYTPSASYFSASRNASPCSAHCVYEASRHRTLVGDIIFVSKNWLA